MSDWVYEAEVVSVYDGDTITVDLDMGMRVWQKGVHIRLKGINAPEMRGASKAKGTKSRDALRTLLPEGTRVTVVSHAFEKFGRLLGTVYAGDPAFNVNQWMIDGGLAVPYLTDD